MKKYIKVISAAVALGVIIYLGFFFSRENKIDREIKVPPVVDEKETGSESGILVRVIKPAAGSEIDSPVEITGEARGSWFFEASFPVRLVDSDGNTLGRTIATAEGDWMTEEFVPFRAVLVFNPREAKEGELILEKDNPSGLPEHDASFVVPVKFSQEKTTTVKVFFGNENLNSGTDCAIVYPVERIIPRTQAVGRAALEQLVLGPTAEELTQGYFTSLNPDVKVQTFSIQHGVAFADFDDQLGKNVAGSCRVMAIRAQIEETLKQFPTVTEVVIFINGQMEDVLQP